MARSVNMLIYAAIAILKHIQIYLLIFAVINFMNSFFSSLF